MLRIAVPNKGRLRAPALRLLESAGIEPLYGDSDRALVVPTSREDVKIVYVRAEDIPSIVASGAAELGITGRDYVVESGARVEEVADLGFGRARLVVAVPRSSGIRSLEELPDGVRVATKYVNIARKFFEEHGIAAEILRISGASEVMPSLGACDAVVDIVSTGTTMRLHGLVPIATVLETSARLIKSPLVRDDEDTVNEVIEALRSVVRARRHKLVLMNVPDRVLHEVLSVLPSMSGPTLARIEAPEPMWEVMTVVPIDKLSKVVFEAKKRGARDILVLSVERVIP
ncbi:ATP phosphoribosyltransferase [Pyrofollis japonicus]|uniref:ATP phosphoribosyltransferase n=1 Tax=Pyrofollis japonicus TaxID=3060460 RepID=UPI00295B5E72|nr:ATP phosphoribosyltransferase [Pyrofollis japonicus]